LGGGRWTVLLAGLLGGIAVGVKPVRNESGSAGSDLSAPPAFT
jgi:hypothetical protein